MKQKETLYPLLRHPAGFIALGGGAGLAPKAPGTFGTLVAIPFLWPLSFAPLWLAGILVFLALMIGIPVCDRVSQQIGKSDPGAIVWDEIVALWLVFLAVPLSWYSVLVGFLLFRLFDIFKPWPISWADRKISGGTGIMLDDVLAAIYATVVLRFILYLIGHYELG